MGLRESTEGEETTSLHLKVCFRKIIQIRESSVIRKLDWLVDIPIQGMSTLRFLKLQCLCSHMKLRLSFQQKARDLTHDPYSSLGLLMA